MRYRKITLEDNKSILVEEFAEIKEGDIAKIPNYAGFVVVGKIDDMPYSTQHRNWQGLTCDTCFDVEDVSKFIKVIATINHSISLDIPMVIVEDEVEKLANILYKKYCIDKNIDYHLLDFSTFYLGFKTKVAQQKYVYSEEDLIKATKIAWELGNDYGSVEHGNLPDVVEEQILLIQEIIQSIKQEYIELEMGGVRFKDPNKCGFFKKAGCIKYICDCYTLQLKTKEVNGQLIAYLK